MNPDVFYLPAILGLGIISTISDIRIRRISNQWIILSLIYAVIVHGVLLWIGHPQELMWIRHTVVNFLISTAVALFFWKKNWWGGGDAKLFMCYSALIPIGHYHVGYFSYYFASFLLLMATFIPAALWTFLHAQGKVSPQKIFMPDFKTAKIREFFEFGAGFAAVFFLWNLMTIAFNYHFHLSRDFAIVVWLVGLAYYKTFLKLFQNRFWLVVLTWVVGICLVLFLPVFSQINTGFLVLKSFIYWLVLFILQRHVLKTIDHYVEWTKDNNMAFAGWMFLGVLVIWVMKFLV
jgi:Flp pilus assembly protein protease CpaA